jgi:hypothetical protein
MNDLDRRIAMPRKHPMAVERALDGMVKVCVGTHSYARAFLVARDLSTLFVTAAHCLPRWPVKGEDFPGGICLPVQLMRLRGGKVVKGLAAFVDPFCDLALVSDSAPGCDLVEVEFEDLGRPGIDPQQQFDDLAAGLKPVPVRLDPLPSGKPIRLHLCTRAGRWVTAEFEKASSGGWPCFNATFSGPVPGGTSGSPVLDDDGRAVGVLCRGGNGSSPVCGLVCLAEALPHWAAASIEAEALAEPAS